MKCFKCFAVGTKTLRAISALMALVGVVLFLTACAADNTVANRHACDDNTLQSDNIPTHCVVYLYNFTCPNGVPLDEGATLQTDGTVRCKSCDPGYVLNSDNEQCDVVLIITEQPKLNGDPNNSGVTISLTVSHDAELWWVVYSAGTTIISVNTIITDATGGGGAQRSGTTGIMIDGETPHNIVINGLSASTSYGFYAAIVKEGTNESLLSSKQEFTTTAPGFPWFELQPATTITSDNQTSADISLTADDDEDGTVKLYWAVYNTAQIALTATELKNDATSNNNTDEEVASSGSGETAAADGSTSSDIEVTGLEPQSPYYFYAAIEDDDGNLTRSTELFFVTSGYPYVCQNGMEADGTVTMQNINNCASCENYFKLESNENGYNNCTATSYTCENGDKVSGSPNATDDPDVTNKNADVVKCTNCDPGYALTNDHQCLTDDDLDGAANVEDIDDDNDGLIEIGTIEQLYNVRYDLAGASYDDEADDSTGNEGDTNGTPTAMNKDTDYVCGASATGTCGYELSANLSFDIDGDGDTWTESEGTYTLDSDDDNDSYFDVDSGGWEPIGDADNGFNAMFDGNDYTITGLAIQRADDYLGLFGVVANGSIIHNLTIADSVVIYSGSDDNSHIAIGAGALGDADDLTTAVTIDDVHITGTSHIVGSSSENSMGGLAGSVQAAHITGSSSTADLFGAAGDDDIGGLVGTLSSGSIMTSYATGAIMGGAGTDDAGGLVGEVQEDASVIISYATGNVDSGAGANDTAGGLVGRLLGTVNASYATGDVDGGSGNGDYAGGLVGSQGSNDSTSSVIVASYATGNTTGGEDNNETSGGLVGLQVSSAIIASYATGSVTNGRAGGLVGWQEGTNISITASYATGNTEGFFAGKLVGEPDEDAANQSSYGFGDLTSSINGTDAAPAMDMMTPTSALGLTSDHFTGIEATHAWKFLSNIAPVVKYADYDGPDGTDYSCDDTTLLVGELEAIMICSLSELPGQ